MTGLIKQRQSGRIHAITSTPTIVPTTFDRGDEMSSSATSGSAMRETMEGQAEALAGLLADPAPPRQAAQRLRDRRLLIIGTGTSWHAAEQGAWLLRSAGCDVRAAQSVDAADDPALLDGVGALVALTHTGAKRYTARAIDLARAAGAEIVQISGRGVKDADITTVSRERSAAYTASHLGTLLRLAQIAEELGAALGPLAQVPEVVHKAVHATGKVDAPTRLIEFIGGGINQWTAAEGALKIREAAYIASEGLSAEQFLHGPSVALRSGDRLVCLDGGGPSSARIAEIASAAADSGVPVTRIIEHALPEPLSIFALTVAVQRISLESAEAAGVNPDTFGRDVPGRDAWQQIEL
jgi:glucosamine--fructose-6-phosphate aminotransferase (isomerizing)